MPLLGHREEGLKQEAEAKTFILLFAAHFDLLLLGKSSHIRTSVSNVSLKEWTKCASQASSAM